MSDNATYFVSQITIVRGDEPNIAPVAQEAVSGAAAHVDEPGRVLRLPGQRIVTMNSYIEL
jgi:hypothetical protein